METLPSVWRAFVGCPFDKRVDVEAWLLVRQLDDDEPQRNADVRRGDPDARRGPHRVEEVVRQGVQRLVEGDDGGRHLAQARIRKHHDRSCRHRPTSSARLLSGGLCHGRGRKSSHPRNDEQDARFGGSRAQLKNRPVCTNRIDGFFPTIQTCGEKEAT
ncbi:hypothetical protein HNQ73_002905 [Chelatococcus composti]|uniref:Uncharacterized protein n=1 Tax=Chelatococcus composti TaxID=1743235 RepID=A0A841K8U4_9HYPH|nr:hypothetical protein [Chelatococcus composti]